MTLKGKRVHIETFTITITLIRYLSLPLDNSILLWRLSSALQMTLNMR